MTFEKNSESINKPKALNTVGFRTGARVAARISRLAEGKRPFPVHFYVAAGGTAKTPGKSKTKTVANLRNKSDLIVGTEFST